MSDRRIVWNSADEAQISKAKDWQDDVERDLDEILQSRRGRRWLRTLVFDICHIERSSHVPGDPESTARNDGVRMIGQTVVEQIKARDHGKYILMLEERQEDEEA